MADFKYNSEAGTVTQTVEIEAVDIPTMAEMPPAQYRSHVESELLFQDHHGVIRMSHGEYPLAVTQDQVDALIELLTEWRAKADYTPMRST
ncbi:hypothetical protein [Hyphococcus sp.]|uniref:hypothetical protein n=1 Tax=Hyphococcus sp. TaxID=2038636 RepID=UPI0035C74961